MPVFDNEFKNELRRKVDLISYIGRYLRLEKSGSSYKACCPFHAEKTPSFFINPDYYHCFGCGESGDIIKFVQKYENLDFVSAVTRLAQLAGMEMPDMVFDKDAAEKKRKKERLLELTKQAAHRYHKNLSDPRAEKANQYLKMRGIQTLKVKFGLGYSFDSSDMVDFLLRKGFSSEEIVQSGIGTKSSTGVFDNFAGRLIFPIINNYGEVVTFGGRIIDNSEAVKYYNGRNTLLFEKSKVVYGINLLKKKKQLEKKELTPIMTEGYMDVISLHKAGFDTAVASMGTALTKEQCRQLKGYGEKIFISYDGDGAGRNATMRGLDILDAEGLDVRVVELPDGLDPDDVIKKYGAAGYQDLLDKALPLTDFKLKTAQKAYNIHDAEERQKYSIEAAAIISALPNPVAQEEYFRRLARETGYTIETLQKQAAKSETAVASVEDKPTASERLNRYGDEEIKMFLLNCWYKQKPFFDYTTDVMRLLENEYERNALYYLQQCKKEGKKPNAGEIMDIYGEQNSTEAAKMMDYSITGDEQKYFQDCIKKLNQAQYEAELNMLNQEYENAKTPEQRAKILIKINKTNEKKRSGGINE